jgi:uncharacterized membrane protein YkvI
MVLLDKRREWWIRGINTLLAMLVMAAIMTVRARENLRMSCHIPYRIQALMMTRLVY